MLIDCANLVCNEICSEYFLLKYTETILPLSNKVQFENLERDIFQVVSVSTENGKPLKFAIFPLCFEILDKFAGNIVIEYNYIPAEITDLNDVLELDSRVTARVFAYGIASEFHLLNGNYDEALMYDKKFRDALLAISPKRNIKVTARNW